MVKRKLIHPRKVIWCMEDFINEIHNLTYERVTLPEPDATLSTEEWVAKIKCEEIRRTSKIRKVKKHGFCAINADDPDEEFIRMGYSIEQLYYSKGSKEFRANFVKRCPLARGFADVTLALLHELGHFYTACNDFGDYDRKTELAFVRALPAEMINRFYFELPDEQAATNWAIEWLNNPENRKTAKAFEKKFFKNFAKTY